MRFAIGLLVVAQAWAQSSPDPAALLAGVGQELEHHRTYQFTQEMTMNISMPGIPMPAVTYTTVTQGTNSGKTRTEAKIAAIGTMLTISDGKQTWIYMPTTNSYTHSEETGSAAAISSLGIGGFSDVPDGLTANAKVTGSEIFAVDGDPHESWLIESRLDKLDSPQPGGAMHDVVYTSWIDKRSGLLLKLTFSGKANVSAAAPAMETSMTMIIHSFKFDEELPDSLFVFTPPDGAKETKELFPGMSAMMGGGNGGAKTTAPAAAPAPAAAAPKPNANEPEAFVPYLRPVHEIEPEYPAEARAQKLQGFVELLVTVDPTGTVSNAEVLSGRDIFRGPALDAVQQWTFPPVIRNGHPVSAYTEAMVNFRSDPPLPPSRSDFDVADTMKEQQRIQELEAKFPRSPEQVLADAEDQMQGITGYARFEALSDLAKKALDAGDLVKAKAYATELIEKIPQAKEAFGGVDVTDTATFDGNTVLGLVALRQGSVSQARQYLLESAKNAPPKVVFPFGPDFTLARELLAKGERDAVIEFLADCKQFWKEGAAQLDQMIDSVRRNGTF